jgi:hypothetical protein
MTKRICSIPGCGLPHSGRGWCVKHYGKWRKTGDPNFARPTMQERFDAKVTKTDTCWLWTGYVDRDGYGKFWDGERTNFAHRVAHTMFIGPIPVGFEVDHLCFVRNCVRPAHLEAVLPEVNNARGTSPTAENLRKDVCPDGHEYTEANTYRPARGGRQCIICRRARDAARLRSA